MQAELTCGLSVCKPSFCEQAVSKHGRGQVSSPLLKFPAGTMGPLTNIKATHHGQGRGDDAQSSPSTHCPGLQARSASPLGQPAGVQQRC